MRVCYLTGWHLLGLHEGILTRRPVGHHSSVPLLGKLLPGWSNCSTAEPQVYKRYILWCTCFLLLTLHPLRPCSSLLPWLRTLFADRHSMAELGTACSPLDRLFMRAETDRWQREKEREHKSRQLNCSHDSPDVSRPSYHTDSDPGGGNTHQKVVLHHGTEDF